MIPFRALAAGVTCALVSVVAWAQQGGFGFGGGAGGPMRVEVERAVVTERTISTTVGGRLRPANTVDHTASVNGIVRTVSAREGDRVEPGSPLFSIERLDAAGSYMPAVVTSRIAGSVSAVQVQPGQEVRSGAAGVTVIDTSGYSLTANVSDKDAFLVKTGGEVSGRIVGAGELTGLLLWRSPEPDYVTGLYTLRFHFPNEQGARLGQFVSIEVPVASARGIFVPQTVLVRRYGRFYVWTVTEDNTLASREVQTGARFGDYILILRGLEVGDRYLARLTRNEREGMSVVVGR